MVLFIENKHIPGVVNLLDNLPLAGVSSRARSRLISQLVPHLRALEQSERDLLDQYACKNAEGEIVVGADSTVSFPNARQAQAFRTQRELLLNEKARVEETYEGQHELVRQALQDTQTVFTGEQASAYDVLLTVLEACDGSDN